MKNTIIYIDMDDVLCDFMGAYHEHIQNCPEMKFPQAQVDFFRNLKPIKGAIEAFDKLSELQNYTVYILSAPSEMNPLSYMEKRIWVENHLGYNAVEKLILSPNKALLKGDYLIDDYTEGKGQDQFEGKLLNFGSNKFPNWNSILNYFSIE
ncbi:5' nucleotidase, NT5C type [Marinifilum sp.]|uniref:5' nucleotidase, NT5C type n=1 Tax=Marinifilum sp. TaxID=2033137 RepID=UPI003BAAE6B5